MCESNQSRAIAKISGWVIPKRLVSKVSTTFFASSGCLRSKYIAKCTIERALPLPWPTSNISPALPKDPSYIERKALWLHSHCSQYSWHSHLFMQKSQSTDSDLFAFNLLHYKAIPSLPSGATSLRFRARHSQLKPRVQFRCDEETRVPSSTHL